MDTHPLNVWMLIFGALLTWKLGALLLLHPAVRRSEFHSPWWLFAPVLWPAVWPIWLWVLCRERRDAKAYEALPRSVAPDNSMHQAGTTGGPPRAQGQVAPNLRDLIGGKVMVVVAYALIPFILLVIAGGNLCDLYEKFEKSPKTRVLSWFLLPVTLPVFIISMLAILIIAGPPVLFGGAIGWLLDGDNRTTPPAIEGDVRLVPEGRPYGSPIPGGGQLAREIKLPQVL